jgi:hypothetical protein
MGEESDGESHFEDQKWGRKVAASPILEIKNWGGNTFLIGSQEKRKTGK